MLTARFGLGLGLSLWNAARGGAGAPAGPNLDSALKRGSAINIAMPWRAILPIPDGTVAQGDRQTVALIYGGVL